MSRSNGDSSRRYGNLSQFLVEIFDHLWTFLTELSVSDLFSSVFDVLFQERLVDDFNWFLFIEQHPDFLLIVHVVGMIIPMHIDDKTAQIVV